MRVYTIGYDGRSRNGLLVFLSTKNVKAGVDVRLRLDPTLTEYLEAS